jgi:hypothetical protein
MKPYQPLMNQNTQRSGNTRNKIEGPASKKTNEPPKMSDHKYQVPKPLPFARSISNKERGGPPKRTPNLDKPIATTRFKIETTYTHYNIIDTFYI